MLLGACPSPLGSVSWTAARNTTTRNIRIYHELILVHINNQRVRLPTIYLHGTPGKREKRSMGSFSFVLNGEDDVCNCSRLGNHQDLFYYSYVFSCSIL